MSWQQQQHQHQHHQQQQQQQQQQPITFKLWPGSSLSFLEVTAYSVRHSSLGGVPNSERACRSKPRPEILNFCNRVEVWNWHETDIYSISYCMSVCVFGGFFYIWSMVLSANKEVSEFVEANTYQRPGSTGAHRDDGNQHGVQFLQTIPSIDRLSSDRSMAKFVSKKNSKKHCKKHWRTLQKCRHLKLLQVLRHRTWGDSDQGKTFGPRLPKPSIHAANG